MKRGTPPTARKARTGELTPPGITAHAASKSAWERGIEAKWEAGGFMVPIGAVGAEAKYSRHGRSGMAARPERYGGTAGAVWRHGRSGMAARPERYGGTAGAVWRHGRSG